MGNLEKIYSTWHLRFLLISCHFLSWSPYLVPVKKKKKSTFTSALPGMLNYEEMAGLEDAINAVDTLFERVIERHRELFSQH